MRKPNVRLLLLVMTGGVLACANLLASPTAEPEPDSVAPRGQAPPLAEITTATLAPERSPSKGRPPTATPTATPSPTALAAGRPATAVPGGTSASVRVEILEWEMGAAFDLDTFTIGEPKQQFGPEEEVYILLTTMVEGSSDVPYRADWTGPDGLVWIIEESIVSPGWSRWFLEGNDPVGGWQLGEHSVELFLEDELAQSWSFTVVSP